MNMNWQNNKSPSNVHLKPFNIDEIAELQLPKRSAIASYPRWIAIVTCNLQFELFKLSSKNMIKVYRLDIDKNSLGKVASITSYQDRKRTSDIDDGMRLILRLGCAKIRSSALEIWNANNRQLLQSIALDAYWDSRIIANCQAYMSEEEQHGTNISWYRHIKVISLSKGAILERIYPANEFEKPILIPQHNLVVFRLIYSPLVIISLLNEQIQQHANISNLSDGFNYFQHIIDTKIIGHGYDFNQYCIIDVVTGDVNVYSFPIPAVKHCTAVYGHMVLMAKETTLITSFVLN
ncbi:hypothetical protein BDF19DRAFT_426149 [Syncephalis fuscata]|nr:hypothetical protein BDF19DRAFT_426149 [Syncephalis fuscata]